MSLRKARRRIHLIGIGGMGMSALAEYLHCSGFTVTGSDSTGSAVTERLASLGVGIQYHHEPDLIRNADLVVYSSAIGERNAERAYAKDNNVHLMRRAEVLGELMRSKFTIAISGTHGKTTTTALMGHVFRDAQRDPTIMAGGILKEFGSNMVVGSSNVLIAEADEFDRSFLSMSPSLAVVTNIDADHLDCYGSLESIKDAFVTFAGLVPFYGGIIACIDNENVRSILPSLNKTIITYSAEGRDADYQAVSIVSEGRSSRFEVVCGGETLGSVSIAMPGVHNVANSLGVLAAAMEMGIPFDDAAAGCGSFRGVQRRFEIVGCEKGVTVVDDYAHHPSEIQATIAAARRAGYSRVIAVFQPHLYTRTRDLADQFAQVLSDADRAIVTEIYKSREEPIAGVSADMIRARAVAITGASLTVVSEKSDVVSMLPPELEEGDVVLVMGAGDINGIAAPLLRRLADG